MDDGLEAMARVERTRAVLRPDLERLDAWGEQHPERFGGLWWDDPADWQHPGPATVSVADALRERYGRDRVVVHREGPMVFLGERD